MLGALFFNTIVGVTALIPRKHLQGRECIHRGKIQAKGKGEIDMYFVELKS